MIDAACNSTISSDWGEEGTPRSERRGEHMCVWCGVICKILHQIWHVLLREITITALVLGAVFIIPTMEGAAGLVPGCCNPSANIELSKPSFAVVGFGCSLEPFRTCESTTSGCCVTMTVVPACENFWSSDIGFLVTRHWVQSSDVAKFGDRFYNKSVRHWVRITNVVKIHVKSNVAKLSREVYRCILSNRELLSI